MNHLAIPRKDIAKVVAVLLIGFSGWFLPAAPPITPIGMKCLTDFLAASVGWSLSGEAWPSFIMMLLFPATGVMPLKQFLTMGWGSDVMFFLALSLALIAFMEVCGVSSFLASWFMTRPFLEGHPWRLIFMVFFAAYWICCLVNTFLGIFLMWDVVYNMTATIKQKPYDKFPTLMIFGIALFGALSLTAVPWGGNAIVNLAMYAGVTQAPVNLIEYVLFTIPYGILSIFVYIGLCKYAFRLDASPLQRITMDDIDQESLVMTPKKKIALISLGVFVVMLLGPSLLPRDSAAFAVYQHFGIAGVIILFLAGITLLQLNGEPIFPFAKMAKRGIPWNLLMMVTIILAVGGVLLQEQTGIKAYLEQNLVPLIDHLPGFVFVVAVLVIVVFLTNFLINMVVVALFLPVVIPIAESMGMSADILAFTIMLASSLAFLTPPASAASSVLFPNKEWIRVRDIYKYGVPTVITMMALLLLYYYAWSII